MDGVIEAAGSSVHVGAVKATKERSDAGACERSDGLDGAGGGEGHATEASAMTCRAPRKLCRIGLYLSSHPVCQRASLSAH